MSFAPELHSQFSGVQMVTIEGPRGRIEGVREIVELARRGKAIPSDALLTPSARDRAKALGLRLP